MYDKTFLHFVKGQNIQSYSTNSNLKAVFVERFIRTFLDLVKEPAYIEGKACWLNHLDNAMEKYNNHVHGTTKMTPFEAGNDEPTLKVICISSLIPSNNNKLPKFQVGDYVRVLDKRDIYSKERLYNKME